MTFFSKPEYNEWEKVEFRVDEYGKTSGRYEVPYVICTILSGTNEGKITRLFQPRDTSKSYHSWKDTFGEDLGSHLGSVIQATAMPKFGDSDKQYFCKFELISTLDVDEDPGFNLDEIPF